MRDLFTGSFRRTRHAPFVFVLFALMCAIASVANAQSQQTDTATAVNTAIQVFATAADAAGLPTGLDDPTVQPIVAGLVTCAVSGTSGGDCAKNVVVSTVLSEVSQSGALDPDVASIISDAVGCLTSGSAPGSCLSKTAISQLPPEAQPVASCILGGGNVGDCAVKSTEALIVQQISQSVGPEASQVINCIASGTPAACATQALTQNLPDSMKPFATCLSQGGSLQSCAANLAAGAVGQQSPQAAALVGCLGNTNGNALQQCAVNAGLSAAKVAAGQAAQQAVSAISQLDVNASATNPSKFPQEPAVLQNIVMLTQGIQTGDWVKMGAAAGSEILETAGKIILSVFVTPPVASLLAPVVDAMI